MDVYNMYVGDCSYTPRHSVFRDYERFPYGSLERNSNPQKSYYEKVQEKLRRDTKKPVKKEPCPFCQEQKKRPLIAYMRKMALEKQKSRICEEEENEDHCHYDANENEKKWILSMDGTIRFYNLTSELDIDMILDGLLNLIWINILTCPMGFHLTKH